MMVLAIQLDLVDRLFIGLHFYNCMIFRKLPQPRYKQNPYRRLRLLQSRQQTTTDYYRISIAGERLGYDNFIYPDETKFVYFYPCVFDRIY